MGEAVESSSWDNLWAKGTNARHCAALALSFGDFLVASTLSKSGSAAYLVQTPPCKTPAPCPIKPSTLLWDYCLAACLHTEAGYSLDNQLHIPDQHNAANQSWRLMWWQKVPQTMVTPSAHCPECAVWHPSAQACLCARLHQSHSLWPAEYNIIFICNTCQNTSHMLNSQVHQSNVWPAFVITTTNPKHMHIQIYIYIYIYIAQIVKLHLQFCSSTGACSIYIYIYV